MTRLVIFVKADQMPLFGGVAQNPKLHKVQKTVTRRGKTFTQTYYEGNEQPQPSLFSAPATPPAATPHRAPAPRPVPPKPPPGETTNDRRRKVVRERAKLERDGEHDWFGDRYRHPFVNDGVYVAGNYTHDTIEKGRKKGQSVRRETPKVNPADMEEVIGTVYDTGLYPALMSFPLKLIFFRPHFYGEAGTYSEGELTLDQFTMHPIGLSDRIDETTLPYGRRHTFVHELMHHLHLGVEPEIEDGLGIETTAQAQLEKLVAQVESYKAWKSRDDALRADFRGLSNNDFFLRMDEYDRRSADLKASEVPHPRDLAVSDYALTNHKEWFAETMTEYLLQPDKLKDKFPEQFAACDKIAHRLRLEGLLD